MIQERNLLADQSNDMGTELGRGNGQADAYDDDVLGQKKKQEEVDRLNLFKDLRKK